MDERFQDALRETADGLLEANAGMKRALEGMKRTIEAAVRWDDEHEDLRETVRRLETLVMDLVEQSKKNGHQEGR